MIRMNGMTRRETMTITSERTLPVAVKEQLLSAVRVNRTL